MTQEDQPNSPKEDSSNSGTGADAEVKPLVITLPDDPASGNDWYLWAGVLALLTLVAFWPAITGVFIWDDDHQIMINPTASGLLHAWIPPLSTIQYYPLTNSLLWIQGHLWGTDEKSALGFHVVNLILHAAGAIVLWRLLRRLALPAAWLAAAVWAVHPLQAETVCWISELKNVLSGVLTFSSLLFFLEYAGLRDPQSPGMVWKLNNPWQAYAISLGFFVLAMFSKSVACSLAPALIVILWWKQLLTRERVQALIPYFAIGLLVSICTAWREADPNGPIEATGPEWQLNFVQHLLVAARGFWFYLGKIVFPANLSFNYPRIVPTTGDPLSWLMLLGALALLGFLYAAREKIGRGPVVAFLCYGLALFPSLGFVNVLPFRYSFVADHFQYLAGVSIIALIVAVLARALVSILGERLFAQPAPWQAVMPAILLVALGSTAWLRAGVFIGPAPLWFDVLAKNPDSWLAGYNLAKLERNEARDNIRSATQARQSGNAEQAANQLDIAKELLNQAEKNLTHLIADPRVPSRARFQAHYELANVQLLRTDFPGADVATQTALAQTQAQQAIEGESQEDERHRDPGPYYTMGEVKMVAARSQGRRLLPDGTTRPSTRATTQIAATLSSEASAALLEDMKSATPATMASDMSATTQAAAAQVATTQIASTRATTRPATRPVTVAEQQVIDNYEQARFFFVKAMSVANQQARNPNVIAAARQLYAQSALQLANVDYDLAGLARNRFDVNGMDHYTSEAINAFSSSLQFNPANVEAHYTLAKCLVQFGDIDNAIAQCKQALIYAPNHQYAPAYDELGILLLSRPNLTMEDLYTAMQCFKDAVSINPNDRDLQLHLAMAQNMIANARPATRATTGASSDSTTKPAS
jgi:tetratricopeptide (TPR) repeat protein